uniref:Uncharacterized protein n=1 Tax=Anguilla anguilla TaxID=7936 RepID=A0A0E9RM23_ANGAN
MRASIFLPFTLLCTS